MGIEYSTVDIDADGEVDQRRSRGVHCVRTYFNWVKSKIQAYSNESEEWFAKLTKNVDYRCPVMNLFLSADVQVDAEWELVSE